MIEAMGAIERTGSPDAVETVTKWLRDQGLQPGDGKLAIELIHDRLTADTHEAAIRLTAKEIQLFRALSVDEFAEFLEGKARALREL